MATISESGMGNPGYFWDIMNINLSPATSPPPDRAEEMIDESVLLLEPTDRRLASAMAMVNCPFPLLMQKKFPSPERKPPPSLLPPATKPNAYNV